MLNSFYVLIICLILQVQEGTNSDMMLALAKNYRLAKEQAEELRKQKQDQADVVYLYFVFACRIYLSNSFVLFFLYCYFYYCLYY